MAKLHFVKRAAKNYRKEGIKRGESYYWWKFPRKQKMRSKTQPRRSVYLTQSDFLRAMMNLEDDFNRSTTVEEWDDIANQLRRLAEECEEKAEAISGKFPNGCPTIDLLTERKEACEGIATELEEHVEEVRIERHNFDSCDQAYDDVFTDKKALINWEYE